MNQDQDECRQNLHRAFRQLVPAMGAMTALLCQVAVLAAADTPPGSAAVRPAFAVVAPPDEIRNRFSLSPFYEKYVDVDGFPIVGSARVSDFAMLEAADLVSRMLSVRPDIREAMIASKTRCAVMAYTELTTDIPEHSDLTPKRYWDRRARGLGATSIRPAISCAEENLLGLPGDPYASENILIHEFAHAMHEMGLRRIDKTFDDRLKRAYEQAMKNGLWNDTYAATNRAEYWAEGVQSWFDTNRPPDKVHNDVDTREELKAYDPSLAALIAEIFGDDDWRYVPPARRKEPGHLAGFDREHAGRFQWPEGLEAPIPRRTRPRPPSLSEEKSK